MPETKLPTMVSAIAATLSALVGVGSGYYAMQAQKQAVATNEKLAEYELKLKAMQLAVTESSESRAERESRAKLDQFVYAEIVKLFELAETTPPPTRERREKVVTGLVLSMASPGLQEPFTQALSVQVRTESLKKEVDAIATYYRQNGDIVRVEAPAVAAKPGEQANPLKGMKVDLFYCDEDDRAEALKKQAEAIAVAMKLKAPGTTWRVRDLQPSVNRLPGMSVRVPQVRYNAGENELKAADELAKIMDRELLDTYRVRTQFKPTPVRTPTPGYVSVFLCGVPSATT